MLPMSSDILAGIGEWVDLQWQLRPSADCPLECLGCVHSTWRSSWTPSGPVDQSSNFTNVTQSALPRLRGASVLMVGDSTATRLLRSICTGLGLELRPWLTPPPTRSMYESFSGRAQNPSEHMCGTPGSLATQEPSLRIAAWSHFGVTGPPYWPFAYPVSQGTVPQQR